MGGEHVVRRGEPSRPLPKTFEQRPTTKLDSDQLRQLLTSVDPMLPAELEAEIEIVTPMLDDILPKSLAAAAPLATGSLVEIAVPAPAEIEAPLAATAMTRWPVVVFALTAAAWIACSIAGL